LPKKISERLTLRVAFVALCLGVFAGVAHAQPKEEGNKPGDSTWSTGRTVLPDNRGQLQPQGWTGPISTESEGAAPAGSPQGGTPPPMQPAPGGSSKSIVDQTPDPDAAKR
jgi:hypothetical protein